MDKEQNWKIMQEAVQPIIAILEARLNTRLASVEALAVSPIDNIPESVRMRREEEASKIRAVIQEQRDIISILKTLYPNV